MPKQLNVNLGFTADTSQAKKQIQELRQSLQDIAKLPGKASSLFDDTDIKNASKAALELQQHLNAAVNVNTGKLDLSRLSTSLKAANKDLNEYYGQLTKIGPQGQEAFLKLAKSISTAEAPVTRVNAKLAEMGTTLKNTVRWQLSSSIIHGFMGTIQGAYGYAQDLNESLNNIRIVTGQSVDEMAKFAEKANASAKALSTTTTAYTDAALIFYQQGLSGKEVTDRTDTVIKMANVTRQSAEEVSSYMTAIWNNFYDGSASLEHYADVITALGAATASSSAEISEGLSKFASVADTIGLSYDYATSILAALVANTRQSADVIGTSLKTIFARLQSVKLGETLEDGVELTKYTSALDAIGVSVLDLNGNLRDADDILTDTATKWDTLNKAQQASVAQTVAGTRQYAQFIAMMENWDDVEKNLQTAQGAEGTLQNQADIYAESWEAAQKRVRAAAQGIYQDLLDDKFFIGLTNGLEKVLEAIHGVIKGFGGMKGVLMALGSIFLTTYAQKMPEALNNLRQNFMVLTGQATKLMTELQNETNASLAQATSGPGVSESFKAQAEGIQRVNEMQQKLIINSKSMTETEREAYKARIANVQAIYDEVAALAKETEELEKTAKASANKLSNSALGNITGTFNDYAKAEGSVDSNRAKRDSALESDDIGASEQAEIYNQKLAESIALRDTLNEKIEMIKEAYNLETEEVNQLIEANGRLSQVSPELQAKIRQKVNETTEAYKKNVTVAKQLDTLKNSLKSQADIWQKNAKLIDKDKKSVNELKTTMKSYISVIKDMGKQNGFDVTGKELDELENKLKSSDSTAEDCAAAFDAFQTSLQNATGPNTLNQVIKDLDTSIEDLEYDMSNGMNFDEAALQQMKTDAEAAAEANNRLKESLTNARHSAEEEPQAVFSASTAWTQFAGAAMATYSAVNSIKNAFSTFTDVLEGNASTLDVVGAGVSALMSIMMAYNAVAQLTNTLKKSESIMNLATAFTENTVVGAKIADIAATLGLEAAMAPLLVVTLAIIAAMAALAVAIIAVIAIFKAVQAATPEGKLKALKEEATECSKALDEAKTAAEELKSAFDNYDSLVERLNECTQGTQEWKDALIDVNNAVLDLMANYPDLAQYVTRDEKTGQLKISQTGMDSMRDSADAAIINAQAATVKANANVKNQEIDMQAESIAKSQILPMWLQDKLYNDPQSLSSYDDIRQMIADNYDPTYEENPLDKNSAEFQQWLDEQIVALKEIDGMDELIAAIQANTLAQETGNQAIADNILANDKNVQGSKYVEEVTSASGDVYGQLYENALTKLEDDGWGTDGISKATKVNDEAKRVFSEYAEAAGLTGVTLTDTTGADGNRKFVYEDAEGNETTVSLDAMRKIKAAADAQEQLGEAAQNLIQTFTQLDQSGQAYDKAIMEMLSNKNFENSTQSEIEALKDLAETDEDGMAGVLGDKFGGEDGVLDNIDAQALGYESAEEMITAFEQGIEDYETAVENIGQNWLQAVQSAFENIDTSELTLKQQKTIGNAMNQAFAISGEEGLKTFTGVIENIPTDNLDEFANTIGQIDWQNTSVGDLKDQLEAAGISTVGLDEKLQNLIDVMQIDGVESVDKLTEAYKNAADIIKDLKDGDTISADDYAALDEDSQKYFQLMMDGTYQLIGKAEELQRLLNGNGVESFRENIKNYQDQNVDYSRIQDYDFDTLSTSRSGSAGEGKFDSSQVQQQLDILKTLNGATEEQIALWQQELDSGTMFVSSLDEIGMAVQGCGAEYNRLNELIASNNAQIEAQKEALAASSTSLAQLDGMLADTTISTEAYNKALDNVTRAEAEIHKLDYDDIVDQANALAKAYDLDESAARQLAIQNQRLNRGLANLVNNIDDWKKGLKETDKTSMDYIDTVQEMSAAIVDMVGASEDLKLDGTFIEDNLDLITKAAEGSEEAINNLGIAVARFQVEAMQNPIDPTTINGASSAQAYQEFENWKSTVLSGIDELQTSLDDLSIGDNVFDKLGGDDWVEALNQMALTTQMSVDEMNSLLNSMGVQAEVSTVGKQQKISVPIYTTETTVISDDRGEDGLGSYVQQTSTRQTGVEEMDGYVEVAQINTGENIGKKPTITYTGNSSPSTSAKNGGDSGKKGGGKTPEHKTKDKVEKFEADPFHKVNQELEDVEHNLKMINKQQSHMFGKELINNLKQQNAQLEKQTELHREKLAIAQREANALRSQLQAEGVAFDGDNIANYNAMLQAAENQINALINQYNALSAAEQEAWDKAAKDGNDPIKQAEKYYEELKKQMDKYTDYMSTVYSEEEAIQDALFQQIENNLKAYEVEIELKLDMSEARRAMNKFLKDMSTDIKNMYKTSAEWATIFQTSEKDAGTYKDDINTKLKQLEDYKNASVGGADDMFATESEKYKAITDLEKEILEDSENLLNEYQTAYDNLRDAFGEVADQFNEILDQFDSINDTLDHYAKVIELLYGGETDNGREQLAEVYSLQKENSLARQDAMRKWGDELQKRRADAIAKGYDEDDSYIKDIDAQIEENSKNLESEIENYIDTIQKELENSIKMAQSQMDKSIWGASMADARQEWDDKKAMADGYYDSVERIYQLESLESKWKAAITNTSSLKAQQQLAAIMDKQVASLESKNSLSEKDIELAEKELAVYQAQIALEEAQNNKNSMKLTRDEAGNWSYQYVADEDDIADKQQSYLDKINEWRTASINAAEEIAEKTMDAYEAFSERMTEIMNDVTLSEEERDAKIAELNETYWGEDGIITKLVEDSNYIQSIANQATYIELASLYEADEANLERMTEAEKTLIENMNAAGILSYESLRDYVIGDDGKSGIYGEIYDLCKQTNEDSSAAWKSMAADAINRMYKDPDSVSKSVEKAYADMKGALKIYDKAIVDSEKASGIEWSKVGLQLDGVQKKIGDTADKVDDITGKLGDLSAFEDAVLRIKEMWDETAGSIRQATSDLEDFLSLLANSDGGSGGGDTGSGGSGDTGGGSTGGGGTGGGSGGDGNLTVGETVTYTGGTYYHDSYGATPSGSRGPGKKVKVTQIKEDGRPYPIHVMSSDSAYGWLTKGQLSGYDTGGYTGDWAGGEGRLALLHHKELVLNAQDTQNILAAVDSIRQIASLGSSISGAIASSIGNMIMSLTGLGNNNYGNLRSNATNEGDNVFNITAEFPNANSVETIQEAIMSLPTLASQYLSRDRK